MTLCPQSDMNELTREDYMVLICAALCETDPPVVTKRRFEKLGGLGLVRAVITIEDTHRAIQTLPKGREVALAYVNRFCEE